MNKHSPIFAILALLLAYTALLCILTLHLKNKNNTDLVGIIKKYNHLYFFSLLFIFSSIATIASVELIFLTRKLTENNVVEDFKIIDNQITLISDWNYWFFATIISSLIFFAFKTILQLYRKTYLDNKCNEEGKCELDSANKIRDKKILGASFIGDLIKTLVWPIIISIVMTIDFKKSSPKAILLGMLVLWALVTFVHFHHNISTNSVFGDLFFQESDEEKLSFSTKFKYIGFILIASAICAIPFAGARLALPQIFKLLNIEYNLDVGIDIFNKNIDIFTNTDAFLTVCMIDCLCLILGFMLIDFVAKKLFTKYYGHNEEISYDQTAKANPRLITLNSKQQAIEALFPGFYNKNFIKDSENKSLFAAQGDAQHKFDIDGLRARFSFLSFNVDELYIKSSIEKSISNSSLENLLENKKDSDLQLLQSLRKAFTDPNEMKKLKKDITQLKKNIQNLISELEKQQLKANHNKDSIHANNNKIKIEQIKKLKIYNSAISYLESQLMIIPTKIKAKNWAIKIGLSIASTIVYHALTQIQTSINKYGHDDWRSIAIICVMLLALFAIGFLLHMQAGRALVGAQSIFNKKNKTGEWYEDIFNGNSALSSSAVCLTNSRGSTVKNNTNNIENTGSHIPASECRTGCMSGMIKSLQNPTLIINTLNNAQTPKTILDYAIGKIIAKDGCCGNKCGETIGLNRYENFVNEFVTNNQNIDETLKQQIKDSKKCMCEACCMPTILKKIILDKNINLDTKLEALELLDQATKSNTEKAMSGVKMKGGSCPCSNLAKGDKESQNKIFDTEFKIVLTNLSKKSQEK